MQAQTKDLPLPFQCILTFIIAAKQQSSKAALQQAAALSFFTIYQGDKQQKLSCTLGNALGTKLSMGTAKKWTMPIRNWRATLSWFLIEFEERLSNQM
jgi:hypothetical protein